MPHDYRAGSPPQGQPPMADPYPDTPEQRKRTAVVIAVAITAAVTAVVVAVGIVLLAGSGGSKAPGHSGASSPIAKALDQSTLLACKEAHAATHGGGTQVGQHADSARSFAALSDVPALRDAAARNTQAGEVGQSIDGVRALTAAYTVDTWCVTHQIPGN